VSGFSDSSAPEQSESIPCVRPDETTHRTVIEESDGWWIGWLLDLPGVNAQERTREELIESLRIGAEDMLAMQAPFDFQGVIFHEPMARSLR